MLADLNRWIMELINPPPKAAEEPTTEWSHEADSGQTCIDTPGRFRVQTAAFLGFSAALGATGSASALTCGIRVFVASQGATGFASALRHVVPGVDPMPMYPISGHWGTFPLRDLVEEVYRPLASRLTLQDIRMVIDIPTDQTVTADRELLRRAVRNLVLNAVEAMPAAARWWPRPPPPLAPSIWKSPTPVRTFRMKTTASVRVGAFGPAQRNGLGARRGSPHRRTARRHVIAANCPEGGAAFTLRIPRRIALEAAA